MPKINKKILLIAGITAIAIAGLGGYALMSNKDDVKTTPSGVRLTPPTEQELSETEQRKKDLARAQEQAKANPEAGSTKKQVSVVITNASQSTVNSYVSGVFEDGGICTATFTSGAKSLTKTSVGFPNASYTQCPPVNLEAGFLSPGQWKVTVGYSSATAEGTSLVQTIEVN